MNIEINDVEDDSARTSNDNLYYNDLDGIGRRGCSLS